MYFDRAPKNNLSDLYDYKNEYDDLLNSLKKDARLVIIKGLRRMGKTSLLLTTLSGLKRPCMIIDGRSFIHLASISTADFIRSFEKDLNQFLAEHKSLRKRLLSALQSINGVEVGVDHVGLSWRGKKEEQADLSAIFDVLGKEAEEQNMQFVIAFDEAQEFRRLVGLNLTNLIAHIYDYVHGLQIVITGSEIGLVDQLLDLENPKAPLYGRHLTTIVLHRLSDDESKDFLKKGFEQVKVSVDDDFIDKAVKSLDGIIGWLTYLGAEAREKGRVDEKFLDGVIDKAAKLAAEEYKKFIDLRYQARRRYNNIMESLAESKRSWSDLKKACELLEGRSLADKIFNDLLSNLCDAGFVLKDDDGNYDIADPLVREAVKNKLIRG
jgi:AAA+ ATPase superfamily predicted ATPase